MNYLLSWYDGSAYIDLGIFTNMDSMCMVIKDHINRVQPNTLDYCARGFIVDELDYGTSLQNDIDRFVLSVYHNS